MSEKKTDRRTLRTRKAICDAFAELLSEKELHKITVQEIADKADVNRVTFYKHYLDVYDLYDKIEELREKGAGFAIASHDRDLLALSPRRLRVTEGRVVRED